MLESSTGELLANAESKYRVDKGDSTLKHYAALKGLTVPRAAMTESQGQQGRVLSGADG